jgi:hypothetical protein
MTEFKHEPIKQVIIQDIIHQDIDIFLYQCYTDTEIRAIWVDGMIITFRIVGAYSDAYKDLIAGVRYYESLTFVKYPNYVKSVKWNGGNYELMLLDYSNNPRFTALAKWIKSQPIWKTTPEKMK